MSQERAIAIVSTSDDQVRMIDISPGERAIAIVSKGDEQVRAIVATSAQTVRGVVVYRGAPVIAGAGAGTPDTIRVPFSFGDATPKPLVIAIAGQIIFTVQLIIQVPFDGLNPSLQIGDEQVSDRLMAADQNNPAMAAEYEVNPAHTYATSTPIFLTINPGEGATQGSGLIILEI